MLRLRSLLPALALLGAGEVTAPRAVVAEGVTIARIPTVSESVQLSRIGSERWAPVAAGAALHTGERVRTGPSSMAVIEFPWCKLVLGASSVLSIPAERVLSSQLDAGRVEVIAESGQILKVRTPEAQVRGEGRVVVRREGTRTLAMALVGPAWVEAGGQSVALAPGEGTVVEKGMAPTPARSVPLPPTELWPVDALYVQPNQEFELRWSPAGGEHHLQILGVDSDLVLLEKDVGAPPLRMSLPWLGTFRWRVSLRDARGLEGVPSAEGLVCVVEQ